MESQKEPTLEEYGLDASSYENCKNEIAELNKKLYKNRFGFGGFDGVLGGLGFIFLMPFSVYSLVVLFEGNFIAPILCIIAWIFFVNLSKNNNEKEKENENELYNKINIIKSKITPFEEKSIDYYRNYLNSFYLDYLYKKHSGSDEFDENISKFSSMIDYVENINNKFNFNAHTLYNVISIHRKYLSGRQVNNKYKTDKKFSNFNNIDEKKETTQTKKTDLTKKVAEEIFKDGKTPIISTINKNSVETPISIKDDIKSEQVNKDNIPEIKNKENKGFWASIMDDVNSEIDKSNSPSVNANKEKENIIDTTSPENKYRAPRKIDWDSVNKNKKITGLKGEEIVLEMEKSYLDSIGRQDLSEKVKHVSKEIGDGLGYDILSYFADEQEKYIEVKSTNKSSNNSFYLSQNELEFMKRNKNNSVIYRIFNINESEETPTLRVHRADDILGYKQITPVQYMVKME